MSLDRSRVVSYFCSANARFRGANKSIDSNVVKYFLFVLLGSCPLLIFRADALRRRGMIKTYSEFLSLPTRLGRRIRSLSGQCARFER